MKPVLIIPIVEGHGEVEAVPLLIRRVFQEFRPDSEPKINPPTRIKVGSFLNDQDYFTKYIRLATAKAAQADGTVLILLDCEDGCPATIGPSLLSRAKSVRSDARYIVALAHREYETWFLAAANSLRGCSGLPTDLNPPLNPEACRGAKEWLQKRMTSPYDEIIHQAKFTARFNLKAARSIPSFARLVDKLIA